MQTHLRKGIEQLRRCYSQKLVDSGVYQSSDHQLADLTLSELEKEVQLLIERKKHVNKHFLESDHRTPG